MYVFMYVCMYLCIYALIDARMYVRMLLLNTSREFLAGHNALDSARKQTKNYIVAPSLWLRTAKSAAHFNNAYGEFPE